MHNRQIKWNILPCPSCIKFHHVSTDESETHAAHLDNESTSHVDRLVRSILLVQQLCLSVCRKHLLISCAAKTSSVIEYINLNTRLKYGWEYYLVLGIASLPKVEVGLDSTEQMKAVLYQNQTQGMSNCVVSFLTEQYRLATRVSLVRRFTRIVQSCNTRHSWKNWTGSSTDDMTFTFHTHSLICLWWRENIDCFQSDTLLLLHHSIASCPCWWKASTIRSLSSSFISVMR
jgi:hypothetical protein